MKIIIAPDSFKGSLSSMQVIAGVKQSALSIFPSAQIVEVPIADGGDGTVEAIVHASDGRTITAQAHDPLGRVIDCIYGDANGAAIIGMSECSGMALLSEQERNPLITSTHGTGDLIKEALDSGFTNIYLGIGGSATNDAGSGALQALGLRYLRANGSEIARMCGQELASVARVDDSELDPRLKTTNISIMCDVTNPLTGKNGATYIYGPQKGGTPKRLEQLEAGMKSFEFILNDYAKKDVTTLPGAGAAGGIGCGLVCFAGAVLTSGIDAVLELVKFDELIERADLIVTGEGQVDAQSASGKVVHGVANYAKAQDIPVVVIAGSIGSGAQAVYPLGVNTLIALPESPTTLQDCIQNASALLAKAADRVFSLLKIGKDIK
ncbi:MAG: glycerate kinase [Clostridia bacterium]|jgi:glycerate 2-kinase|nr:glycerate kinase [Clostridia bacterium]MBT7122501.1 glycerate kinase [Clostridia bacterium]